MRIAIILIVSMSVLSFGQSKKLDKSQWPKELLNAEIPDFTLYHYDNVTEFTKGSLKEDVRKSGAKRIVLSFFASWCANCWTEFELMKRKANELEKEKVRVYLIDVDENIGEVGEKIKSLLKKYSSESFALYFDTYGTLLEAFGFAKSSGRYALPIVVVLDSDLRVLGILTEIDTKDFPQVLWKKL